MKLNKKERIAVAACIRELTRAQQCAWTAEAHSRADEALCDLLELLGLPEVVSEFYAVDRYYE